MQGKKMIMAVLSNLLVASTFFAIILDVRCHKEGKSMTFTEKSTLKLKTIEMFEHAYDSYMKYAFPADELMPLSCKGRNRGSEQSRGDIDDALGNFSLTLIDTLDTLAVFGKVDEFETQVKFVLTNVSFNTDAVVSVFETNIRVLGGLLGAHSVAKVLKSKGKGMLWYDKQLLDKATDIADRLLPAFNTTTGIPYPKVNLRFGINTPKARVGHETDTCTACAGTMIMEFGALSRLTGNPIYEEKAHKAMEALWQYRSQHTDLVGTTINIHNGNWIRRDSGIGAGIDSYYEYCLKAYILFGDDWYLEKFNKHYAAIERYIKQGYMMVDVMMNEPHRRVRSHVDALQAFWPGLQVLKGDLQSAIETHEMLYSVAKKYKFLPEAFTIDFNLFWAQHPLRPEFVESTYFLYQATKDPYYLNVGKHIIDSLEKYARVPCGFAALKDLRTLTHENKMDSFVLAETFKYLYLLFSEESEHTINVDDFIFTTEAHLLPLYLSTVGPIDIKNKTEVREDNNEFSGVSIYLTDDSMSSCPNIKPSINDMLSYAAKIRKNVKLSLPADAELPTCSNPSKEETGSTTFRVMTEKDSEKLLSSIKIATKRERRLKASEFVFDNNEHLKILKDLGINVIKSDDGKVQLMHQSTLASSTADAEEGLIFMQEMIQISKEKQNMFVEANPRVVELLSEPFKGNLKLSAGSAQFGKDLAKEPSGVVGELIESIPYRACERFENSADMKGRVVVTERGDCMFIDKVRLAQKFGAVAVIIIDHFEGTAAESSQSFAMSGDSNIDDVTIPSLFLFRKEGDILRAHLKEQKSIIVRLAVEDKSKKEETTAKPTASSEAKISSQGMELELQNLLLTKPHPDALYRIYKLGVDDHAPGNFYDTFITEKAQKQDVLVNEDGSKVTTTFWEYIGFDKGDNFKKIMRRKIEKCPTSECNSHVKIIYVIAEEPIDESESSKTETHSENFLNLLIEEVMKSKFDTVRCEKGLICTTAGCHGSIEEMRKFYQLTSGILKDLKDIQDRLKSTVNNVLKKTIPDFDYQSFKEIIDQATIKQQFLDETGALIDNDNNNEDKLSLLEKIHKNSLEGKANSNKDNKIFNKIKSSTVSDIIKTIKDNKLLQSSRDKLSDNEDNEKTSKIKIINSPSSKASEEESSEKVNDEL